MGPWDSAVRVTLIAGDEETRRRIEATLSHPAVSRGSGNSQPGGEVRVIALGGGDPDSAAVSGEVPGAEPELPTVVVSASDPGRDHAAVRRALRAGAAGYVRLEDVERALVPTVLAVAAGQSAIPAGRRREALPPTLTHRKRQVLSLVVMGLANAEIAERLFVAESTVKSHLSTAFAKLGVSSRNEATARILDPRSGLGMGILRIPRENG